MSGFRSEIVECSENIRLHRRLCVREQLAQLVGSLAKIIFQHWLQRRDARHLPMKTLTLRHFIRERHLRMRGAPQLPQSLGKNSDKQWMNLLRPMVPKMLHCLTKPAFHDDLWLNSEAQPF